MNSDTSWVLQIDPQVFKTVKRFPPKDRKRILVVLANVGKDPFIGDIQKIKGEENVWRRRVGSYRVFFEIYQVEKAVHIFHVERRTSTTY